MKKLVCSFVLLSSSFALANDSFKLIKDRDLSLSGFDFAAPVVSATSAVSDKQVGMIVYDASSEQFKGLNSSGNWDVMTVASGNPVTSAGSSQRVERITFGGATRGTNNCGASPCTIHSQSGTWVQTPSGVTRSGTGIYVVNFVTSPTAIFSDYPSCTCSAINQPNNSDIMCSAYESTSGLVNVTTFNSSGMLVDAEVDLICMGPR
jgi:hypothetical protein